MLHPKKFAGLITDSHPHLLDHMAPLCSLLDMPLFVTEQEIEKLCKTFYPDIKVQYVPKRDLSLKFLEKFNVLFSSTSWKKEQKNLFKLLFNKNITLAYLPHGNSDKGHIKPLLDPFCFQDHVLIYGQQMIDHLKKQNLFQNLRGHSLIGNIRLGYYLQNKTIQISQIKKLFSYLNPENKTLLYAPTWNDYENLSSFASLCQPLIDNLPTGLNLVIKPHPLIKKRSIEQYLRINLDKKNVLLLDDIPYVYPILEKVDAYIGDFSSVGYDFLYFKKPMFFFDKEGRDKKDPSLFLHQCGVSLNNQTPPQMYKTIQKNIDLWPKPLRKKQEEIYSYAFGKITCLGTVKSTILSSFQKCSVS